MAGRRQYTIGVFSWVLLVGAVGLVFLARDTILKTEPLAVMALAALLVAGAVVCVVANTALEVRDRNDAAGALRTSVQALVADIDKDPSLPAGIRLRADVLRQAIDEVWGP